MAIAANTFCPCPKLSQALGLRIARCVPQKQETAKWGTLATVFTRSGWHGSNAGAQPPPSAPRSPITIMLIFSRRVAVGQNCTLNVFHRRNGPAIWPLNGWLQFVD